MNNTYVWLMDCYLDKYVDFLLSLPLLLFLDFRNIKIRPATI